MSISIAKKTRPIQLPCLVAPGTTVVKSNRTYTVVTWEELDENQEGFGGKTYVENILDMYPDACEKYVAFYVKYNNIGVDIYDWGLPHIFQEGQQ